MNRQSWIVTLIAGIMLAAGAADRVHAQVQDGVKAKIESAQAAVSQARDAIAKGKELVALIPEDSAYLPEVTQMLQAASSNWKSAVEALRGANESFQKISAASNDEIAKDYEVLAKINADVAASGAKVVQIGLAYVEAVASNKTEALDLIRNAMEGALAASAQVQFNYDRVKNLISEKYSN